MTPTSISSALEDILNSVQEKKETCERKRWTVTVLERTFSLHDVGDKVCGLLDKFKQIGDIAVSVDPLHAGLPWAFIRLFLQVQDFPGVRLLSKLNLLDNQA
jgi:hypothetical protein